MKTYSNLALGGALCIPVNTPLVIDLSRDGSRTDTYLFASRSAIGLNCSTLGCLDGIKISSTPFLLRSPEWKPPPPQFDSFEDRRYDMNGPCSGNIPERSEYSTHFSPVTNDQIQKMLFRSESCEGT